LLVNTHIALGLVAALVPREFLGIEPVPIEFLLCSLGAIFPDIDEPSSTISRPGNLLHPYFPRPVRLTANLIGGTVSKLLKRFVGHRTLTHWPSIPLFLLYIAIISDNRFLFFFALGFLSHILGDLVTRQGIPAFAPLSLRSISLFPLRVGGLLEKLLSAGIWSLLVYYLVAEIFEFNR